MNKKLYTTLKLLSVAVLLLFNLNGHSQVSANSKEVKISTQKKKVANSDISKTNFFSSSKTKENQLMAFPNPMDEKTRMLFVTNQSETVQLAVYNQFGKKLVVKSYDALPGKNIIIFSREDLDQGIYVCKIEESETNIEPLKLIIN
jgi:hypothetical protein